MIIYGIPNCNTVKKSMTWLNENGFKPEFHDFKKQGISVEKLNAWCDAFGWEKVLNRKGTTWRKLSPEAQANVIDQQSAVALMMRQPSTIKRPVVEINHSPVLIGFDAAAYEQQLKSS